MKLLCGIIMALAGLAPISCGTAAEPAGDTMPFTAAASVDELMEAIVIPASDDIFDAVTFSNGAIEHAPSTAEEWAQLRLQALAVAEAGNLLLLPDRVMPGDEWVASSAALTQAAVGVARAAENMDVNQVLEAGSTLYSACVACHQKYTPEPE